MLDLLRVRPKVAVENASAIKVQSRTSDIRFSKERPGSLALGFCNEWYPQLSYRLHLLPLYITTIATQMPRIRLGQDSEAEKRISLALNTSHNERLAIRAAGNRDGVLKTS